MQIFIDENRLIIGIIAAFAGVIAGIIGNELAKPIIYFFIGRGKPGRPVKKQPSKVWITFVFAAALSIILGSAAAFIPSPAGNMPTNEIPLPSRVEIDGKHLSVYGQNGKKIWETNVLGIITKAQISDLNNDQMPEVIVGIGESGERVNNPRVDCGKLIIFDSMGKIEWDINFTSLPSYAINVGASTGTVVINNFLVADLFGDAHKEIVVLSHDLMWYPSKLTIVLADGTISAEYWHPGFIYDVKAVQDKNNHKTLLVARAVNNDLATTYNSNPSVVFALDPLNIKGQAPPYIFFHVENGSQLWYGLVDLPAYIQDIETRTMPTGVDQVILQTNTGHFLYINPTNGEIINIIAGQGGVQQYPPEYRIIK